MIQTEDELSDVQEKRRRRLIKYFATLDIFGKVKSPETGITGTLACNRGTHPTILDGVGDSMQQMQDDQHTINGGEKPMIRTQESINYKEEREGQLEHGLLSKDIDIDDQNAMVLETQMGEGQDLEREEEMAELTDNCDSEENDEEWKRKV